MLVSIPKRVSEALKLCYRSQYPSTSQQFVSIPKRVSEALKLKMGRALEYLCAVSIPKRVSEALKLLSILWVLNSDRFQSLKGFQRL